MIVLLDMSHAAAPVCLMGRVAERATDWGDAVPPDPPALRGSSECEPLGTQKGKEKDPKERDRKVERKEKERKGPAHSEASRTID